MCASAEHDPWQLAWHLPLQSALAIPLHFVVHSLEHVALQAPMQSVSLAFELHFPAQVPSHVVLQSPSHVKFASAWHLPEQVPEQLTSHCGGVTLQLPAHDASSLP
jgi:hypothetical protein